MLRVVAIAKPGLPLFGGCRISLENYDTSIQDTDGGSGRACVVSSISQPCMDATMHSDLAFIEQKVFAQVLQLLRLPRQRDRLRASSICAPA